MHFNRPMAAGGHAVKRFFNYINVGEIDATFQTVQAIAPNSMESTALIIEGPFRFFRVRDPDNNVLEVFSIDQASSDSQ